MITNKTARILLGVSAVSLLLGPTGLLAAEGGKPKVLKPCMQCHTGDGNNDLRGKLGSVSMKAETIKIDTGKASWIVNFDEDTSLDGAEAFNKIGKGKEILVNFRDEDGALFADSVAVKPPAKLDPSQMIKVDELMPLVQQGPEAGKFTIVDARPGKLFIQGHIPGAISIYDAQFDKNLDKLPKNKENLLVFYCGGPT